MRRDGRATDIQIIGVDQERAGIAGLGGQTDLNRTDDGGLAAQFNKAAIAGTRACCGIMRAVSSAQRTVCLDDDFATGCIDPQCISRNDSRLRDIDVATGLNGDPAGSARSF